MTLKETNFLTWCLLLRVKYMSETKSLIRHILISWIAQNIDMSTSLGYYINCLQINVYYQNQQGEGKFNWKNWPLDVNIGIR